MSDDQNDDRPEPQTDVVSGAVVGSVGLGKSDPEDDADDAELADEVEAADDEDIEGDDLDADDADDADEGNADGADQDEEYDEDGTPRRRAPERSEDRLTYDCSDWAGESRGLLDALLNSEGIVHTWLGTVLEVPVTEEERVDAVIDEVLAAATAGLDAERDKVVYEVATWSSALQTGLAESLSVGQIAYQWDEHGDLVVYADDEERVEEIFEGLPDPDDPDLIGDDGIEVQDQLSRLFVAAGHLAKRPKDADSVVAAAEVADRIEQISVPFGFEPAAWRTLVSRSTELRDALTEIEPEEQLSDEELVEMASDLRKLLRQYV